MKPEPLDLEKLKGKKILYREFPIGSIIKEGIIEGISPSKNYIKINGEWLEVARISILEELDVRNNE